MISTLVVLALVALGVLLALVLVGLLFLVLVFIRLLSVCTQTAAARADIEANGIHSPHYYK